AGLLRPAPAGLPPRLWRSWPAVASGVAGAGITLFALMRGTDLTSAPALFAIGLGPLYAVIAGLLPGVRRRLWAAFAGVSAVIAWQLLAGADGILFASDPIPSGADALAGVQAPVTAARELWRPLA